MIGPFTAGGTLIPSRFVKISTVADNQVLAATAGSGSHGDPTIGITQMGTRNTPYGALDDGNAALVGENIHLFGPGEVCMLECGGTVTAGDFLKSNSSGQGITASTDADFYGAIANQSGTVNQLIEVQVVAASMRGG